MNKLKRFLIGATAGVAILARVVLPAGADSTVVISGNTSAGENQPGWLFNRDISTTTPFEFNSAQPSIGTGSLYVMPIGANASDKFIAENFVNTPIANVNSISYDFRIGSGGDANDDEHFYMNVYANFGSSPDNKFYDCRYNVVPTTGSTASFTTVTFNPSLAYPVTQSGSSPFTCPSIPNDMNTSSPISTIRVFTLNVGDTSVNDQGLDGYLDKVVVNLDDSSGITTYDFEPLPETVTVTIDKYIDGTKATATTADNSAFPMSATWNATNIGAGSGNYDLDADGFNNIPTPYQAITSEMTAGADYTTNEVTGGSVVGASCSTGQPYALVGYTTGDTFSEAQSGTPSSTIPSFTDLDSDKYVIVWNMTCPDVTPTPNPFAIPAECSAITGLGAPIVGTNGSEVINGTNGNDLIFALGGSDVVNGKEGNDCIVGGDGSDSLHGQGGNDVILGGNGSDAIQGDAGNDWLYGQDGSDSVKGASGNDHLFGGNGSDSLKGDGGTDSADGGANSDSCNAETEDVSCEA
ncbi:MAG: calcium-binding protein [Candidatus Levybacteria bacterium]|nr:calcium-binding protein [Candidatus Levybacteria bacterium]